MTGDKPLGPNDETVGGQANRPRPADYAHFAEYPVEDSFQADSGGVPPVAAVAPALRDDGWLWLGRYEQLGNIGNGAMGQVVLAQDHTVDRLVAIKTLKTDLLNRADRDDATRSLIREVRASFRLNHPDIVQLYDFGLETADGSIIPIRIGPSDRHLQQAVPPDACHVLVFEFVMPAMPGHTAAMVPDPKEIKKVGTSLHHLLENHQSLSGTGSPLPGLPLRRTLEILIPVARALAYALRMGVTHRDLKPSNILIASNGRPKLTDFGMAGFLDRSGAQSTLSGKPFGTPLYMSPEQAAGLSPVDHRSDMYSFGILLYTLLTGSPPFPSGPLASLIHKHVHEPLPLPRQGTLPAGLAAQHLFRLVQELTEKKPSNRPATWDPIIDWMMEAEALEDGAMGVQRPGGTRSFAELALAVHGLLARLAGIGPTGDGESPSDTDTPIPTGPAALNGPELIREWANRDPEVWNGAKPRAHEMAAERLISLGHNATALEVLADGLGLAETPLPGQFAPGTTLTERDYRLRQLLALSLARSGDPAGAFAVLDGLTNEGCADGETLGLKARTRKDLAHIARRLGDEAGWRRHLTDAYQLYRLGFDRAVRECRPADACYNGINAASFAAILGDQDHAHQLANLVLQLVPEWRDFLPRSSEDWEYWVVATEAEAHLVLGNLEQAARDYTRATEIGQSRPADLESTRKQAQLLCEVLGYSMVFPSGG